MTDDDYAAAVLALLQQVYELCEPADPTRPFTEWYRLWCLVRAMESRRVPELEDPDTPDWRPVFLDRVRIRCWPANP
jgi:hypothetical protein